MPHRSRKCENKAINLLHQGELDERSFSNTPVTLSTKHSDSRLYLAEECARLKLMRASLKEPICLRSFAKRLAPSSILGLSIAWNVEGQESYPRFLPLTSSQILSNGEQKIGLFTLTIDQVDRLYRGEKFGTVRLGDDAISNETLSTFMESGATVQFLDGTLLTIGPNSEVTLDEFVYDAGANKGKMSLNILSGIVKFVSGRMSSESYEIETPSGMATIRGTELVFLVEPDGDMSLGVFSGGASLSVQGQTVSASALEGSLKLLTFEIETPGIVNVAPNELGETYSKINVVFDAPSTYSTFVARYKTEQYKEAIVDACISDRACGNAIREWVAELADLGVDKYDVLASMGDLENSLRSSGADIEVIELGLIEINKVQDEVEIYYEPTVKTSEDASTPAAVPFMEELEDKASRVPAPLLPPVIPPLAPEPSNEAPTDIQLTANTIEENSTLLDVGVLSAVDDNTASEDMVFEVISNGSTQDHEAFSIDPTTQVLSLNDQPDYETQPSYSIRIRATDEGDLSFSKDFIISVLDVQEEGSTGILLTVLEGINLSIKPSDTHQAVQYPSILTNFLFEEIDGLSLDKNNTQWSPNTHMVVSSEGDLSVNFNIIEFDIT